MRREDDLPLPPNLAAIGFVDEPAAATILLLLRNSTDEETRAGRYEPHLLHALAEAANPDQVLLTFERFVQGDADRPALLNYLASQPRAVEVLVRIFSGSQFLTNILLRHPEYLERLTRHRQMADLKGREEFLAEAHEAMSAFGVDPTARLNALRRYQRSELLRIGTCDFTGLLDLRRVIVQLSLLADAIVQACLEIACELEPDESLARNQRPNLGPNGDRFDSPGRSPGSPSDVECEAPTGRDIADDVREFCPVGADSLIGSPNPGLRPGLSNLAPLGLQSVRPVSPNAFAVIALGKLGGEELNYSSDIDLLFIAEHVTPRHLRIARRLVQALANVTDEGFLYRVDMRLRPWGQAGELVSSHDSFLDYLRQHARLWEKQSLLKARVIAGDSQLGWRFIASVQKDSFGNEAAAVRASVLTAKRQIESELIRKHHNADDVKLGRGSIRDIEFVVQSLQLIHGDERPNVRSFNTLDALIRLADTGLLPADDFQTLTSGYIFFRTVEHALQLVHHHQTHAVPESPSERLYLARRLDFPDESHLLTHLNRHRVAIRAVFDRHLNPRNAVDVSSAAPQPPTVRDHVSRLEASYAATFTDHDIARHAELAERIHGDDVVVVDAVADDDEAWRVTIVGYDFTGELSIICGLLLLHGFNILEGDVFTYDAAGRKKIVDVFRVRPTGGIIERGEDATSRSPVAPRQESRTSSDATTPEKARVPTAFGSPVAERQGYFRGVWAAYSRDLSDLLKRLHAGEPARRVQADLAQKIARALSRRPGTIPPLYPIDLQLDNESSNRFTVVRVRALDTAGFLYELTNALALCGVDVSRVHVASHGPNVDDTFFITDADGRKLADLTKQRELRAAVVLIKSFTHLLPHSPDPERALLHFRELVSDLFTRAEWPDEIASLERPEVLDGLARLLGMSDFLWSDLLRMQHANLFPLVRDVDALARPRSATELQQELGNLLGLTTPLAPAGGEGAGVRGECLSTSIENNQPRGAPLTPSPSPQRGEGDSIHKRLAQFRDREMFRVDMRHILGHVTEFGQFSAELTDVAETVIDAGCRLCEAELQVEFGSPVLNDGLPCPLAVCALGKLGGQELGFASDIELMFVYAGDGLTTGPRRISNAEYFARLVEQMLRLLSSPREGIFEIDLRLRPYGRAGSLAVSWPSFAEYFAPNGPAWPFERQSLVKLRPIAGDLAFGDDLVRQRDQIVFAGRPFDVAAYRAMRDRQVRQLASPSHFNAKLSPGGLVEVEYLVQGLQITHGHRDASVRATNTLGALSALEALGVVSADEYVRLRDAYVFLRRLIDALRVVRGNARDLTVPDRDTEEFAFLARRLGFGHDSTALHDDLTRHTQQVRELGRLIVY